MPYCLVTITPWADGGVTDVSAHEGRCEISNSILASNGEIKRKVTVAVAVVDVVVVAAIYVI